MPHQCVRCGKVINDGSKELLDGCNSCKGKFFFYIKKKEVMKEADKVVKNLSTKDINEMEKDVRQLLGSKKKDKTVILDIETIKTLKPGKFKIDVSALMRGEPIIINISEGKYYIDIASAFNEKGSSKLINHLK
ncbi:hypothetical protein GF352_01130 [archaeon]|nr:hypothetical protein [archaeon]